MAETGKNKTLIQLTVRMKDILTSMKRGNDTYSDVIERLLKEVGK
jgi:predicted CopG family antitoxin